MTRHKIDSAGHREHLCMDQKGTKTNQAPVTERSATPMRIRRSSHRLFASAAVLIAISVFVGFSRTYYLHRWFHKPDLTLFLHVHAAAMSLWIALFLIQTLLVQANQIEIHRKLGILGIVSAALVPIFGVSATVIAARREVLAHAQDVWIVIVVLALELTQMLLFAGFAVGGFFFRKRVDFHKRLMLLATLSMLPNAIVRIIRVPSFVIPLIIWSLLIAVVVLLDRLAQRKVHPVFSQWALIQVVLLWLAFLVGTSVAWQHFAIRVVGEGRLLSILPAAIPTEPFPNS